jgi:hypothetical protein
MPAAPTNADIGAKSDVAKRCRHVADWTHLGHSRPLNDLA